MQQNQTLGSYSDSNVNHLYNFTFLRAKYIVSSKTIPKYFMRGMHVQHMQYPNDTVANFSGRPKESPTDMHFILHGFSVVSLYVGFFTTCTSFVRILQRPPPP